MKDLSDLPKSQGHTPDKAPWLAPMLAQAWEENVDRSDPPMASSEARIRHSWAAACARQMGYNVLGCEVTEPMGVADFWRLGTGSVIHERWQEVVAVAFPSAEVEKKVVIPEIPSAGHIDLFMPGDPAETSILHEGTDDEVIWQKDKTPSVSVELKSINGFGFKKAIGARGEAEGPRDGAVLQGSLNALAADADEMKIVYLSLENLSPYELKKIGKHEWQRFAAEWTYTRDEYMAIAEPEIKRMQKILAFIDNGQLPPRTTPDMPKGARIVDPMTGSWTLTDSNGDILQSGKTWNCDYCSQRSRCIEDGA